MHIHSFPKPKAIECSSIASAVQSVWENSNYNKNNQTQTRYNPPVNIAAMSSEPV